MKPGISIYKDGETWSVTITNGTISPVHITGMESKAIARQQANDRIKEMRKDGYLKSHK
jgi:hypothetical protein